MVPVKYKDAILSRPIAWFVIFPAIFVVFCSFIFDLRPTAFYEKLSQQFALENCIEALTQKIHSVQVDGYSTEVQDQVDDLIAQRNALHKELTYFKPSYRASRSDAYFPFVMLWVIATFLLLLAATRKNPIPFAIRAFGISTGCVLAVAIIAQWMIAALYISLWYTRLAGLIMIVGLSICVLVCCRKFVKYFYKPWQGHR